MGIRLAALRQECFGGVEFFVIKKKTKKSNFEKPVDLKL